VIGYTIGKKEKTISFNEQETLEPRKWVMTFILVILIVTFNLGGFKVKPIVILSASMRPYISEGDIVVIEPCTIDDVSTGQVIQYQSNNYTVIHRVIKKRQGATGIELITKGDNNNIEDRYPVTRDDLIGCMRYKIPYFGYPAYLINRFFNSKEAEVKTGAR
jgi:signal peptidase